MHKTQEMVKGIGQIKQMTLPMGYVLDKDPSDLLLKEYYAESDDRVRFSFYYRGHRIPEAQGEIFKQMLAAGPRDLGLPDLEPISLIVMNVVLPEYFDFGNARISDLCGRRVLIVDGYWKGDGTSAFAVYVDSDGTGTAIQEIHFVAPPQLYPLYLEAAKSALKTIIWKK